MMDLSEIMAAVEVMNPTHRHTGHVAELETPDSTDGAPLVIESDSEGDDLGAKATDFRSNYDRIKSHGDNEFHSLGETSTGYKALWCAVIVQALKDDDLNFVCSPRWLRVCGLAGLDPRDALRIRRAYLRDEIDMRALEFMNQGGRISKRSAEKPRETVEH